MEYVGIVLVSHSYDVAVGIKKLLRQVNKTVPIAIAGGAEEDHEIGVSALKIKNAIEEVYSEEGVAIFIDLGSALINTELALEMLEDKDTSKIKIANTPLLEGAYAGTIQSGIGGTLDEVIKVAEKAKFMEKI